MPTNLKSLLSRSRSRNDLKQGTPGSTTKNSNPNDKSQSTTTTTTIPTTAPNSPEEEPEYHQYDELTFQSPGPGSGSGSSMKRDSISSRSLFSLPGSSATASCASSPNHHHYHHYYESSYSKSHPVSPAHELPQSPPPQPTPLVSSSTRSSIRKCETVLALSSGGTIPATPNTKFCKGMKDRILSTSSSALNSLIHSSSKTTSKLFGGFKQFSSPGGTGPVGSSSHNSTNSSPPLPNNNPCANYCTGTTMMTAATGGSSNSLVVCNCNCNFNYDQQLPPPLTPINRLRRNGSLKQSLHSASSMTMTLTRSSSINSVLSFANITSSGNVDEVLIQCRLCLSNIKLEETFQIEACSCRYCKDCVLAYVSFEIGEGATDIACPDATCEKQGVLSLNEISTIVSSQLLEKHHKFRLYKEVESNSQLMWCPSPGCDTICTLQTSTTNGLEPKIPTIQCTRCQHIWCTQCKLPKHPNQSCDHYRQKLISSGKLSIIDEEPFAGYDSIKKCPFCHVPIEKDSGCAQMMCKRCKHVFCWYCLTSLDDDFLLRHYDKGPCKNKLGHSRASVVWHRTQVIGIFAGFGLLVLLASPLLILAAPCLLCCRCRYCTDHLDSSSTDDNPELL